MILFISLVSIACFINLISGIYLIYSNPRDRIHITSSMLLFINGFGISTLLLMQMCETEDAVHFIYKHITSFSVLIPYLALIISLQFSQLIHLRKIHYIILLIPAIYIGISNSLYSNVADFIKYNSSWRLLEVENNKALYIYFLYFGIYTTGYCIANIYWYFKTHSNKQKKQALTLLISFLLAVLIQNCYMIFLIHIFKVIKYEPVGTGALSFTIWTIGFLICLVRYRLLPFNSTVLNQDIISNIDECIILINPEGKIISINDKTKELLQTTSNYYNEHFSSIIKEHKYISEKFEKLSENKIPDFSYRLNLIGKGDHHTFVDTKFKLVRDKYKDVIGFLMIAREVKELEELINKRTQQLKHVNEELNQQKEELVATLENLKKTQQQLIESEKMASLGGLVAGVAHEINTPVGITITAASGLLEETYKMANLFKEDQISRTEFKEYLNNANHAVKLIMSNMEKAATMVQSFKQISVDQSIESKRTFKLKEYTEDIIRSLYPKLKNRKININLDIDSNLEIDSYPGAYSQMIANLALNSLIHGFDEKEKGQIEIKTFNKNSELIIEYKDDGKGIPKENVKKIFDPFFTTNKRTGTGLGLHIVYNLVTQKLGGSIECESEEGRGVVFKIILPARTPLSPRRLAGENR